MEIQLIQLLLFQLRLLSLTPFRFCFRWLSNIRENLEKVTSQDMEQKKVIQTLVDYKLEDELRWLKYELYYQFHSFLWL